MNPTSLMTRRNQLSRELTYTYHADESGRQITLSNQTIFFRWPRQERAESWYASRLTAKAFHEPGTVVWLLALGEYLQGRQVSFIDIGAAFGYFSQLAATFFNDICITAIEPHPESAAHLDDLKRDFKLGNMIVLNVLLGSNQQPPANHVFHGWFKIRQAAQQSQSDFPDALVAAIETRTLASILPPVSQSTLVLKIDTEGTQADFLPPATPVLIDRSAIILLECDTPEKLAPYGTTNGDLCAPFLKAGYSLFWGDHRVPQGLSFSAKGFGPAMERNSLAVLIPPADGQTDHKAA